MDVILNMSHPDIQLDDKHRYTVNGELFPSVTQIISATVPKDLSYWGMKVGVAGVCILYDRHKLNRKIHVEDVDDVVQQLVFEKLTTNHIYQSRGRSGITIHQALEDFGRKGVVPDPLAFPQEDLERVCGLARWILETSPRFVAQEVQTASLKYQYAGTFDARVIFGAGEYKGKECLVDLKTSKYVYPESHFPQLEAYEAAELECGEEPTDYRLVLHLPEDGIWTMTPSCDTLDDFLVLLEHYKTLQPRKLRIREAKKLAKQAAKVAKIEESVS